MRSFLKYSIIAHCMLIAVSAHTQSANSYSSEIDKWHAERIDNLKKENGWLNLVGLYWLKQGRNTFGSAASNDIVFPKGTIAAIAGSFELNGTTVTLVSAENVAIQVNNKPVTNRIIFDKDTLRTPVVSTGSLRWTIIKRDDKIGIRLRDLNSASLSDFKGIERYSVNEFWKVTATLETAGQPSSIAITNVLGQINQQKSPGKLLFTVNNKIYSLDALDEGGSDLFIIFGDQTNTETTYPSGRFLAVPKPGADGKTVIDFNKAYNPPCAFTDFATCPIPPAQNRLALKIDAGEKRYGHH